MKSAGGSPADLHIRFLVQNSQLVVPIYHIEAIFISVFNVNGV